MVADGLEILTFDNVRDQIKIQLETVNIDKCTLHAKQQIRAH